MAVCECGHDVKLHNACPYCKCHHPVEVKPPAKKAAKKTSKRKR